MSVKLKAPRDVRQAGPRLTHFASRIFNTPLAIHPTKLQSILGVLGPHMGITTIPVSASDWDEPAVSPQNAEGSDVRVIPVHGVLVKRSTGMEAASGLVAYSDVRASIDAACADPRCTGIVLDVDSPGGEVGGMFELSDHIFGLRGVKPIVAIANDSACSAACSLIASCDRVFITTVGAVGSIGCVMLHCDQSIADAQNGLTFEYIYSGAYKLDGNPHMSLSSHARLEAQEQVSSFRQMLSQTVARGRSADPKVIYDTEAACLTGASACPMLADQVGTLDDAVDFARTRATNSRSFFMPLSMSSGRGNVDGGDLIAGLLPSFRAAGRAEIPTGVNRLFVLRQHGTVALASQSAQRTISGVLAPYRSVSSDMGGFVETYEPGCFNDFLAGDDQRVVFNHDSNLILGRKSAGTARFWEEPDGLHYSAVLPDTQYARDLQALIQRGDVTGSSAAFYILAHRWEQRGDRRVRVVETARLVEGSPCSFPAYETSSTGLDPEMAAIKARLDALSGTRSPSELSFVRARLDLLKIS